MSTYYEHTRKALREKRKHKARLQGKTMELLTLKQKLFYDAWKEYFDQFHTKPTYEYMRGKLKLKSDHSVTQYLMSIKVHGWLREDGTHYSSSCPYCHLLKKVAA